MSKRPWRFAPAAIKRAITLVKESGLTITRIEIGIDGKIVVGTGEPSKDGEHAAESSAVSADDELERWRRKYASRP